MKAFLLSILLISTTAVADEERSLGKSPDGKFELLLRASSPDDYGWVVIKNRGNGEVKVTDTAQGYRYFPTDDVEATWKGDSTAFAVTVQGTKTTRSTDLYIQAGASWEKLDLPPYLSNILGRQGVFAMGRAIFEDFGEFDGDSRFSLFCHVEPDWEQKAAAEKITEWKPSNQTDWKVVLEYSHQSSPNCRIVSIEPHAETVD